MLSLGHVSRIRGMGVCIYHSRVCTHSSLSLDVIILPTQIYRSELSSVCKRVKGKDLVSRKPVSFVSLADQFINHMFAGERCMPSMLSEGCDTSLGVLGANLLKALISLEKEACHFIMYWILRIMPRLISYLSYSSLCIP